MNAPDGVRAGFSTEEVHGLREARDAAMHFELLRGLTSGSEDDFVLRFAAVADVVYADQTMWTLEALERRLVWMEPDRVQSVLRALRRSGWLEFLGTGYRLTTEGLAVYATLSRLTALRTDRDDDLALGVFDLEASTRTGEDKGPALLHLRHHLRRSVEEVEAAVRSQSEVKVLEARERLDRNLEWSRRARLLLDEIDISDTEGYRHGQRLGQDLSELHRWHSVLQRSLDELGTHRMLLGASGVRPTDVSRYLAGLELEELITLGGALVGKPVWPLAFILDNVLSVAEYELLLAEHPEHREVGWADGDADELEVGEPPESIGEAAYARFQRDLTEVLEEGEPVSIERFVPSRDFPQTCYRMTLLALEADPESGTVEIEMGTGGGLTVYSDYLSEISTGTIRPRGG